MYDKIKKQNGERFAKAIKSFDNGIFDVPEIDKVVKYAGRDAEPILTYLVSLKGTKIADETPKESVEELLAKAGYTTVIIADSKEKQEAEEFKKLFAPGETLCTFGTDRYKNYHVIHCIHENAASLKRSDFKSPRREDDYGVSAISIQIAKKGGFIKICNRYNHAVGNPDNTFSSNPDAIINGLSAALKKRFNVDFSSQKTGLPENYILVGNQVALIEQEVSGIFFGYDFWVENGVINEVDKANGEMLIEYFLYSDRTKTMKKLAHDSFMDSFADDFNKYYGGLKTLHIKGTSIFDGDLEILKCA